MVSINSSVDSHAIGGVDVWFYVLTISSICVALWTAINCLCCEKRDNAARRSAMSNLLYNDDVPPPPIPQSPDPKRSVLVPEKACTTKCIDETRTPRALKDRKEQKTKHDRDSRAADQCQKVVDEKQERVRPKKRKRSSQRHRSRLESNRGPSSDGCVSREQPKVQEAKSGAYLDLENIWKMTCLRKDRPKEHRERVHRNRRGDRDEESKEKLKRERERDHLARKLDRVEKPVVPQGIPSNADAYQTIQCGHDLVASPKAVTPKARQQEERPQNPRQNEREWMRSRLV